jgi:UDP-N-acetylmuramoyl-L-alanyl-D-glutamate--2,6-diaminopimelate ligase
MERYGAIKRKLLSWPGLSAAVVNLDDDFGRELVTGIDKNVRCIAYSLNRKDADIRCRNLEINADGLSMVVDTPWGSSRIESSLLGSFNASNLLAVIGVLGALELDMDDIVARVNRIRTVAGRMERFGGGDQPRLVVDYAHTPEALREVLSALQLHCGGDLWVVFGCGGERDREKRALMGGIAEALADHLVLTDDNPRGEDPQRILEDILVGVSRRDAVDVIRDRRGAIAHATERAGVGDVILVAGKGHEDYQETRDGRVAYSDRETAAALVGKFGPKRGPKLGSERGEGT